MKMNDFLDRYIQGEPGGYFFDIEIMWYRNIQGGMFSYKAQAREYLLNRIITFLNNPEHFLLDRKWKSSTKE
jgi:hypothetical protein